MAARKSNRRRRDPKSGHVDQYFQRRTRFEAALGALGLSDSFARMPRSVQEQFWKRKLPDPVLLFENGFPISVAAGGDGDPCRQTLRDEIEQRFRAASIEVNGAAVSVRDFLSVVIGCMLVVRHTLETGMPEAVVAFLRQARPLLERAYQEHLPSALRSLYRAVAAPLLAHSRLDSRLLTMRMDLQPATTPGKSVPRVILAAIEPQARKVTLDRASRPMYRAARMTAGGVQWISWSAGQLDRSAAGAEATAPGAGEGDLAQYPVYVQSHALRQLRQRVNLPAAAPYLEAWLAESLAEPRIVERQESGGGGHDLLVEYRVKDYRLGYLVVTPLDDLVAVRTFKFLTMQHTPEARMLERQLRLKRRDVDWLGLHELTAFTKTDLSDDPVLRPLLDACGCGHLFALAREDRDDGGIDYAPQPKALAAEVKRYLRLAA